MKNITAPGNFEERLANYVDAIQSAVNARFKEKYPNLIPDRIESMKPGPRYVRIIRTVQDRRYQFDEKGEEVGEPVVSDGQRSCVCFVDKVNGDILMNAGWKTPDTKYARGNIFKSTQPVGDNGFYTTSEGVELELRVEDKKRA